MIAQKLYDKSRYLALIIVVIVAVSVNAFQQLGRQEDPTMMNFVATVTTVFPGATPDRVEALVTRPIEEELKKIPQINEIASISNANISSINIRLSDFLTNEEMEVTWGEIRDALGDASLRFPEGAGNPIFDDDRLIAYTTIVAMSAKDGETIPMGVLSRAAENFADFARNYSGTSLVDIYGEANEEVLVAVDQTQLIVRGLTLGQVIEAVNRADSKRPAGLTQGANNNLLVELQGQFDSASELGQIVLQTNASGGVTRLSDVATIQKIERTPASGYVLTDGRRGILVGIAMKSGLQVDQWTKKFEQAIWEYQQTLAPELKFEISYDQGKYSEERLASVFGNLVMGVTIVIGVLLLTLGWRAAIVVSIILPLCALTALTIMQFIGMSLHQMSITGLIVALGLLVDGSIVMTDDVRKRLQEGASRRHAIELSVNRMFIPLLSSTATTVLTFLPLALLPGPAGSFMGSIATSVIIMLVTSLVLAVAITPVLAARLLPDGDNTGFMQQGVTMKWLSDKLASSLDAALAFPKTAITCALVLPVVGILAFPTLTSQFFPGTDRDQIYIQVKLPNGRSIDETLATAKAMDAFVRQHPQVRRIDWTVGESAPPFYYNMYRKMDGVSTWAEALVLTRDPKQTDAAIRELQGQLDHAFPNARSVVRGIDQGPPVSAPLEVEIYGPDLTTLREYGNLFRERMARIPAVTHTNASILGAPPKVELQVKEEALKYTGFDVASLAANVGAALSGATSGEILEGTQRLPIRVRLASENWTGTNALTHLQAPAGFDTESNYIPLSAVSDFKLVPSYSPITRQDGERLNTVQGYLVRGILPEEALKELQADLVNDPIELPPGYSIKFGGDANERAEVVGYIMAPIGLIMASLLATMLLTFNSWRLTAVGFLVCLCSMTLSLLAIEIFSYPFGLQALIGVIGSIGVSINAAIIIITALQLDTDAARGEVLSMRNVVMDSSRHIVSTTITTFGGFLPLILDGGQFWPPFAMAIAGGVLLSTLISFYLVPPAFLLVARSSRAAETTEALEVHA
ncbi:MAG: efflux RND transporter permease subunit [Aequoribacter sp.]|uniref:efflux RND transporter permease subunit n=1 Tax=Aequoribacter sp. TaxID=2847771 RepID=UPI003C5F2A6C